jgi:hypothetical protein
MDIKNEIIETVKEPMGIEEIRQALNNNINILISSQIAKFTNWRQLFKDGSNETILLILQSDSFGHWVTLLKDDAHKLIEFFCPYGNKIRTIYNFIGRGEQKKLNSEPEQLIRLLDEAKQQGYKIKINNYEYQDTDRDVNTCGRWCCFRVQQHRKYNLNNEQFKKLMVTLKKKLKGVPYDAIVAQLINE